MLGRLLYCGSCCSTSNHDPSEMQVVQLTSDVMGECEVTLANPVHLLTSEDRFGAMMSPRGGSKSNGRSVVSTATATPRQKDLTESLRLPAMRRYPVPPGLTPDDPEDFRRQELLKTFKEFVLDMHKGLHLQQLTANQDYSDIHCQILEDLQTLKVDQGSGCIVEFPLGAVSKVYRIVKNDDKWYSAGSLNGPTPPPPLPLSNAEHIVVVEFMRRKLAFVFKEMMNAQKFLMCMELLIRRAQEIHIEAMSSIFETCNRRPAAEPIELIGGKATDLGTSSTKWAKGGPQQGSMKICACQPVTRTQVLM